MACVLGTVTEPDAHRPALVVTGDQGRDRVQHGGLGGPDHGRVAPPGGHADLTDGITTAELGKPRRLTASSLLPLPGADQPAVNAHGPRGHPSPRRSITRF